LLTVVGCLQAAQLSGAGLSGNSSIVYILA
jgi:hypothetical protein